MKCKLCLMWLFFDRFCKGVSDRTLEAIENRIYRLYSFGRYFYAADPATYKSDSVYGIFQEIDAWQRFVEREEAQV